MRDNQLIMKKQQHMQKQTNEEMKCIHCKNIFLYYERAIAWTAKILSCYETKHNSNLL